MWAECWWLKQVTPPVQSGSFINCVCCQLISRVSPCSAGETVLCEAKRWRNVREECSDSIADRWLTCLLPYLTPVRRKAKSWLFLLWQRRGVPSFLHRLFVCRSSFCSAQTHFAPHTQLTATSHRDFSPVSVPDISWLKNEQRNTSSCLHCCRWSRCGSRSLL